MDVPKIDGMCTPICTLCNNLRIYRVCQKNTSKTQIFIKNSKLNFQHVYKNGLTSIYTICKKWKKSKQLKTKWFRNEKRKSHWYYKNLNKGESKIEYFVLWIRQLMYFVKFLYFWKNLLYVFYKLNLPFVSTLYIPGMAKKRLQI